MNSQQGQLGRVFLILIVPIFLLSGCGGSASDDHAPSSEAVQPEREEQMASDLEPLDVCSLFSKAEAETTLGVSLKDPEATPFNPVTRTSECNFAPADPGAGFEKTGNLLIRVEQPANSETSFARLRELMGGGEEVAGLGDEAFYAASQLFVLNGEYQLTVVVGLFGNRGAQRRETAVKVAETILPRL